MSAPESRSARRLARESSGDAHGAGPTGTGGADAPGPAPSKPSRAGRNLPAAIAVGVGLGAVIVLSLLTRKELMLGVIAIAVVVGVWELRRALARVRIRVPLVPSAVGAVSMLGSAYVRGGEGLAVTLGLTCVGILLWRISDGVLDAVRDVAGGFFVAVYPSFMAGFAVLLLAADDGAARIFVFILVTVCSDVGGYALGVLRGRHPMAPTVSPKKSWEGFAGSVIACVVGGALSVQLVLHGPWWAGALLGVAAAVTATVGDLTESTVKRDLGIKDMSNILPGHGGIMDRLDSLLLVAPVAWAVLKVFVPGG
jgi:phosphatidate cytidylyltransferase